MKRQAHAVDVTDAKTAEGDGTGYPLPVDAALASVGLLVARPKESADDPIHLLDGRFVEGDGREEMRGDGAEDMTHEGKAITLREHGGAPCREFSLELVHDGQQDG